MKLYTEKQVTKINLQSKDWGHYDNYIFAFEISDNENIYTEQQIKETLKLMGLDIIVNEFFKKAEPIEFNQNK